MGLEEWLRLESTSLWTIQKLKASSLHNLYSAGSSSLMTTKNGASAITCRIPNNNNNNNNKRNDTATRLLFSFRPRNSLKKPRRNAFVISCIEFVQALTSESLLISDEESPLDAADASPLLASLESFDSSFASLHTEDVVDIRPSAARRQVEDFLPNVKGIQL
jgi:hypothetical protein